MEVLKCACIRIFTACMTTPISPAIFRLVLFCYRSVDSYFVYFPVLFTSHLASAPFTYRLNYFYFCSGSDVNSVTLSEIIREISFAHRS